MDLETSPGGGSSAGGASADPAAFTDLLEPANRTRADALG